MAAGKQLRGCRGQDVGNKVKSHLPHGQAAMLQGRAASQHRLTPAPERQAPVINEALIWQGKGGRSGQADRRILPPAGLGWSHGSVSLLLGCLRTSGAQTSVPTWKGREA